MSKITNDGLTRSGTGMLYSCTQYSYGNSGRQMVKLDAPTARQAASAAAVD